jgi:hypothetical protein
VAYFVVISTRKTEALVCNLARVPGDFFVIEGIGEVKEEVPPPLVVFSSPKDP